MYTSIHPTMNLSSTDFQNTGSEKVSVCCDVSVVYFVDF